MKYQLPVLIALILMAIGVVVAQRTRQDYHARQPASTGIIDPCIAFDPSDDRKVTILTSAAGKNLVRRCTLRHFLRPFCIFS